MDAQQLSTLWLKTHGEDLSNLSLSTVATFKVPPKATPTPLPKPPQIAYQLGREIGRGGVGRVCEAVQASLRRSVAVKSLLPGRMANNENVIASFLAEAEVTGSLEHPNIVPVYDLHSDARSDRSLVLKLVRGTSWRDDLAQRPDALVAHLEILNQICNAVAFAHSRGIIHNDLKPANVMLGPFGEVLVMDWGLAVSIEPRGGGSLIRSKDSITAPCGTPAYMPAELAEGRGKDLGPWTDIYLLGGLLYRILSGSPPHRGETVLLVLMQAVAGEIEPLDASVPDELRELCMRALALKPEDRWTSVLAFQEALQSYLRRRESLQLASKAWRQLRDLKQQSEGERSRASLNRLYDGFAQTLHGFENARLLAEHPDVLRGAFQTHLAYATCALDHGDLGLAEAQLSKLHSLQLESGRASADAHQVTLARLEARVGEFRARRARERRLRKSLQWSVLGLLLLMLLVGLGSWWNGQRKLDDAINARRLMIEERVGAWNGPREQELAGRVRQLIGQHAGQAEPSTRRELSLEERRINADALKELLHMIADFERALAWADEPLLGASRTIIAPARLQALAAGAAGYREDAVQLALLNDAFDLAEILLNQADLPPERLADERGRLQAAREARVHWQLAQTRAALADVRAGRQRAERPLSAYNLDEYTILLSSFQHPRIARELADTLEEYTEFAAAGGDISTWTQAQREEMTLILEVLGYLNLPQAVLPALTRFFQAVADPQLAAVCARSLCNTRQPAVNDLLPPPSQSGSVQARAWRSALDAFARVPTPQPSADADAAEHLRIGRLQLTKKAYPEALRSLDRALQLDPEQPWAHFYAGVARHHLGDHLAAIASLDRALALGFPDPGTALTSRAGSHLALGRLDAALADLDSALVYDMHAPANFRYRGLVYERQGRLDRAILCFSKAISLDPTSAEFVLQRGLAYHSSGQLNRAAQDFTNALVLDPALAEAYGYRGGARCAFKDWQGAFADLDQAVRRQPQNPVWRVDRARALIALGQPARARLDLEAAQQLDPLSPALHVTWASYHLDAGDLEAAQSAFDALGQLPGMASHALLGYAELHLAAERPLQALEALDRAMLDDPTNPEVLDLRLEILWLLERWDEALAAAEALLQAAPEQGWVYARRGMIRSDAGDSAGAREDFNRALAQLPDRPVLYQLRSKTFVDEERWQEALADVATAHELDPEEVAYPLFEASIFSAMGETDEAERRLSQLIESHPEFGPAYAERGSARYYQNALQGALADYDRALQLDPDRPRSLLFRGYVCYELALWQRADDDLTRAMQLSPGFVDDVDALLYRGEARVHLGAPEAAMQDFERAALLDPDEPWVYDYRAFGHCALQNYEAARNDALRALELGLEDAEPYVLLARVILGKAALEDGSVGEQALEQAWQQLELARERGLRAERLVGPELELLWQDARGRAFLEGLE